MSLKSFFDWLKEEEKKRQQAEKASLNTDVNVFKNKLVNTQSSTVKSGAGASGTAKVQSNAAKSSAKSTGGDTSNNKHNTDMIESDWGLNAKAYGDIAVKPKKASVSKSADMIDNDYGFNVKAMDDYLSKMRSGRKSDSNKGAVIYDDVGDKIKDNKYADTMINVGKGFSNFGKYNHLNDFYYINNPSGLDDGYKYINKDDMNKYFYLLAQHEKGDVDKKDVDDLKHYLFRIGDTIDKKDANELPPIENKPDYSKISSEEQLIYDSFGNAVNKAKNIDYSKIPTDDRLKDDAKDKAIDKAKGIDYNKIYDSYGFEVSRDYEKQDKIDQEVRDYLKRSAKQIIYGNYTDDVTTLGTAGQIGLGLTGLDFAADIRDIVYDFSHWEWSGKHIGQTILDIIGLVPGIGVVKNIDEAAGLVKNVIKNADVEEHTAKNVLDKVDEFMPALKRSMDSPSIAPLLGNVMKSSDEAAGVGKKVVKSGDEVAQGTGNVLQTSGKAEKLSLENGPYIKNGMPNGRPTLSGKKKSQFENYLYNKYVSPDGVLRDYNTQQTIIWKPGQPRKGIVDFGHRKGRSYNEMFQKYKNGQITLDELKEFQFNPDNYILQTPFSNRSHIFE